MALVPESFAGRFHESDVALYVNDVAGIIGDQLEDVDKALKIFVADGERDVRGAVSAPTLEAEHLSIFQASPR